MAKSHYEAGIIMKLAVPDELAELQRRLDPLKLYAVGGAVRDAILGLPSSDVDICGPHSPDEIAERAATTADVDVICSTPKFGTLTLRLHYNGDIYKFEYTAFRADVYGCSGHRPERVEFSDSLQTDAMRRDFTMNALYMELSTGQVIDPVGGLDDLERCVVRSVSDITMADDGLRVLRMMRFACEFEFYIDPDTYRSAKRYAHKLSEIAPERINAELTRLLLSDSRSLGRKRFRASAPQRALIMLSDIGALGYITPALWKNGHISRHAITACALSPSDICIRLAALLCEGGAASFESARQKADLADEGLSALRYPNAIRRKVNILIQNSVFDSDESEDALRLRFASLGRDNSKSLVALCEAVERANGNSAAPCANKWRRVLESMLQNNTPFDIHDLAITGNDIRCVLNLSPSKKIGAIKHALWETCVLNPSLNTYEILTGLARSMEKQSEQ